jgi:hypothetical protein
MQGRRPQLQVLYLELNRLFFRGRLPHYRVRRARLMDPWMDAKRSVLRIWRTQRRWGDRLGDCDLDARCIRVSNALFSKEERRVLLHEMCHAATPGAGHGQAWCNEMRRLAKEGETWAAEEAADYDQEPE